MKTKYIILIHDNARLVSVARDTKGYKKTFPTAEKAKEYAELHYTGDNYGVYEEVKEDFVDKNL